MHVYSAYGMLICMLSIVDRWSTSRVYDVVLRRKWQPLPVIKYRGLDTMCVVSANPLVHDYEQ